MQDIPDVMLRQSPEDQARYRAAGIWPDETFADVLRARVARHPDREAVSDGRNRLSYRELEDAILRVADLLARHGIRPGDVVAVQLPNWIEFVPAYFAIERIGAIGVPVSIDFRARELDYVLRTADCRGVITCGAYKGFDHLGMVESLRADLPGLAFVGTVRAEPRAGSVALDPVLTATGRPEGFTEVRTDPDAMMRMMFTSGTTGNPKGVTHNHNTSLWPARMLNMDMGVGEDEVMLLYLPLALNWGYLSVLQTVLAGCRLVIMEKFTAEAALRAIEAERVTYVATAPASLVAMLALPGQEKYDLTSLRTVISGGTSCPVETIRTFRKRIAGDLIELYGMLECGGYHTYTRRGDDPEKVAGSVGRCGTEMRLRISPPGGTGALPPGETGEIQSQGPGTQLGYYRRPEANAEAFTPDGWFRSGDLGTIGPDGNLRITGRLKEMINRGGKKYYPREVEELLYTHPAILHCAVIGLPDPRLGERNCLCIVPRPGHSPALADFTAFLAGQIATYKLPEQLEILAEMPMTPTGKIQRHRLVKMIVEKG
ncbi:class I adenylate-forming enzyme family protein [Ruixingdingia sedimenti]|uniref:Class I adenylate-forming enzyme family protein n=1 Tax=Ruixingdingia sedimenti TaxID=3073604 RepID=A0ABU1FEZ9_9RHOB|nr:class I adenylate-forming enzyme family protein [Xinfangfangia sp. LG-4]MDR5655460.1 class I adenylate-forming enzyme family protein [Xinfangfangia sp. LG-4]